MKLIPPETEVERDRLAELYTASLPPELAGRYKVVITTGRYGYVARLQRIGPLSESERHYRRQLREYRRPRPQSAAA